MTNDYKEQLLNYITGGLTIESGDNQPSVIKQPTTTNNYSIFTNQILGETNFDVLKILGILEFTNTDKKIAYGNMTNENTTQGVLLILDENMQYIDYITEYSSGTVFNKFELLKADENNLIYGIDRTNDNKYRFIMLNDIISSYLSYEKYTCILRQSYFFPTSYNSVTFQSSSYPTMNRKNRMYKEYNSANYVFIGKTTNNYPTLITVKVNVGESNEWNQYTSNYGINDTNGIASFCSWQNDTISLKIGCVSSNNNYYEEFSFDGTAFSRTKNISCQNVKAIEMADLNDTYIFQMYDDNIDITINYLKVNNSVLDNIYTQTSSKSNNNEYVLYAYSLNGLTFTITSLPFVDFNNKFYCNLIINEDVYVSDYISTTATLQGNIIYVSNQFNLYKIYIQTLSQFEETYDDIYEFTTDYNSTNYNGESYLNYNELIPHKGVLYSDDRLIFSRNLYNKTILNNVTTSTIEIPNTMLNNVTIENKDLLGETNLTLVQDTNSLTKNIYETLFLNFINTLNVIDEDTNTNYPSVSNYINTNINTGTQSNYNDTVCDKYKINYKDGTNEINYLEWLNINKFNKITNITLYISKEISNIQLISDDETKIYFEIDGSSMEIGKYYKVSQKIRTGNKPKAVQLNYNNQNINYNNEPVMVYVEEE